MVTLSSPSYFFDEFQMFSCCEFYHTLLECFIGKYPSNKTASVSSKNTNFVTNVKGKYLFNMINKKHVEYNLFKYCEYLKHMGFGFHENIGYLYKKFYQQSSLWEIYHVEDIVEHLSALYVVDVIPQKHHDVLILGSTNDKKFLLTLYARSSSAPIDVIETFLLKFNKVTPLVHPEKHVSLLISQGDCIVRSHNITVNYGKDNCIILQNYGINGRLCDVIEQIDVTCLYDTMEEYQHEICQGSPIHINPKSRIGRFTSKKVTEDIGIDLSEYNNLEYFLVKSYCDVTIGVCEESRTTFYKQTHNFLTDNTKSYIYKNKQYGYIRINRFILIGVVMVHQDEQSDQILIDMSHKYFIRLEQLYDEFHEKGKFRPIIKDQLKQLAIIKNAIPIIINAII